MTEPRPGEIWRAKGNSLLLVEILEVEQGSQPTVTFSTPQAVRRNLPWFLENFEKER